MKRWFEALLVATLLATPLSGCGGSGAGSESPVPAAGLGDPGPIHVHGLGVNPADGALYIATHTGLFRAEPGQRTATRVADRFQDTMGFTVVGPNHFLGSGHPDGRDRLPPFLGLIRTTDAGRTWKPVSLLGERDFHVLEVTGKRVYGFGSDYEKREAALLVSDDAGRAWEQRATPEPLLSLAIDPKDSDRVLAAGEHGVYSSNDAGAGWRPLSDAGGLLAWARPGSVYLVALDGTLSRSDDAGISWEEVGQTGGPPAAFESVRAELYVALHDGTVKRSPDGGKTWVVRSRP